VYTFLFKKCVEAGENAKVTEYLERVESLALETFSEALKNAAVAGHISVVKLLVNKMGKLPISDEKYFSVCQKILFL
jgi:hypothetical protein